MRECEGNYYLHNGQAKASHFFEEYFLSEPHYIYEVFRVIDGVALFLEDHLNRLKQTCLLSGFCQSLHPQEFYPLVYELIHINQLREGNIKIVLGRDTNGQNFNRIYITEHAYPTAEQFVLGVSLALQKGIRHTPNAKIMDTALRNTANQIKASKVVYETLLVDQEGCITEGSRSNVFFVRKEKLITPPLVNVLPGITRKHIIELCGSLQIEVLEEKVPARSLVIMEAVFISGTSRKVLPVNRIDELEFEVDHPVVRRMHQAFDEHVKQYIQSH